MTRRFEKKNKNPTLKLFLAHIFHWILEVFAFFKIKIKIWLKKMIYKLIYLKNNTSSHFFIKQSVICMVLAYYLFQIIHPSGFCFTLIKKINKYNHLQKQIHFLEKKQFYINNTLEALQKNKTDTVEEFLIKNTGRQLNSKKISHLS